VGELGLDLVSVVPLDDEGPDAGQRRDSAAADAGTG
jgi:hypothetical protein